MTINIKKVKERIAKRNGFDDNIIGNAWMYAMLLTHRTKKQLDLYEQVIQEIADKTENIKEGIK